MEVMLGLRALLGLDCVLFAELGNRFSSSGNFLLRFGECEGFWFGILVSRDRKNLCLGRGEASWRDILPSWRYCGACLACGPRFFHF